MYLRFSSSLIFARFMSLVTYIRVCSWLILRLVNATVPTFLTESFQNCVNIMTIMVMHDAGIFRFSNFCNSYAFRNLVSIAYSLENATQVSKQVEVHKAGIIRYSDFCKSYGLCSEWKKDTYRHCHLTYFHIGSLYKVLSLFICILFSSWLKLFVEWDIKLKQSNPILCSLFLFHKRNPLWSSG